MGFVQISAFGGECYCPAKAVSGSSDTVRQIEEKLRKYGSHDVWISVATCVKCQRLALTELKIKLFELLLDDLHQLRSEGINAIKESAVEAGVKILVQSVFPLNEKKQKVLATASAEIDGRRLTVEYSINSELISGYQVEIDPWVLRANLRDELKFFRGVFQYAH